jgi:hypothetical protein
MLDEHRDPGRMARRPHHVVPFAPDERSQQRSEHMSTGTFEVTHMKAVVLKDYDGTPQSLTVADLPVPSLRPGEVLIQIAATSIGPADLMFLKGEYGITKPLPVVPGFEGSGTVIASGGGARAVRASHCIS